MGAAWSDGAAANSLPVTPVRALAPLTIGFSGGADTVLASGDAATESRWAPIAATEGAQLVRLDVKWSSVAPATPESGFDPASPSDPGYDWTAVDTEIRELASTHVRIMVTVSSAPVWAEGAGAPASAFAGAWKPNAADFGQFAKAIATRYDGHFPDPVNPGADLPRVSLWQGWNEPNVPEELAPQYVAGAGGLQETAAGLYRSLENAFYKAVKGVSSTNFVVLAGLAPYGDGAGTDPYTRTRPVTFLNALLCVGTGRRPAAGCPAATYFNALDSHPYGIKGPNWHAYWAADVSVPDVGKLIRVLAAASQMGTARPAGPKADWVTETSYDSSPPNPGGVPAPEQAAWLEETFYNLWSEGVSTVLWWQLADDPLPASAFSYQAGTYFTGGQPKPSATAFRFPFLSHRVNRRQVVVWSRAPGAGVMAVEQRSPGGWRTVALARVRAQEVFEMPLVLSGPATLRARLGRYTSLAWRQAG